MLTYQNELNDVWEVPTFFLANKVESCLCFMQLWSRQAKLWIHWCPGVLMSLREAQGDSTSAWQVGFALGSGSLSEQEVKCVLCFLEQNLYTLLSNAVLLLLLVTKLCLTLCDPWAIACPGSSVHGISQARILGLTFPSPGDLCQARDWTCLLWSPSAASTTSLLNIKLISVQNYLSALMSLSPVTLWSKYYFLYLTNEERGPERPVNVPDSNR